MYCFGGEPSKTTMTGTEKFRIELSTRRVLIRVLEQANGRTNGLNVSKINCMIQVHVCVAFILCSYQVIAYVESHLITQSQDQ